MSNEDKRFETFNDLTGGNSLELIPSAYRMQSYLQNKYFELSNDELEALSIDINDINSIELIHEAPHKRLILLTIKNDHRILLESTTASEEYRSYELLKQHNIPTLPVYAMKETDEWCAILMEYLHRSDKWRVAHYKDTSDYDVGFAIGQWYKTLHENGTKVLQVSKANIFEREYDHLTKETILLTSDKLGLASYDVFHTVVQYIEDIKRKARTFNETLLYNDFSYENMAIKKDYSEAVMFDYHLMGKGYRYSDIRNVRSGLKDVAIEGFEKGYGDIQFTEVERMVDDVLSPLYSMLVAAQRGSLPKWVKPIIKEVKKGDLEVKLRLLIQNL